ncbi:Ca(2+)/Mn(2+)-transporting P-type ATPase PMR1 [Aspergillus clavatus NRRL 1]|uniref:P-type Ca(2+) transporter n=1 Tax=Aspergillus clavatus (strain ATCC 1007 / CBS 513.65 / DSM 816 / NCTC 3887 / NRRL 1 / QM 1276 / 107) TaxID=344612 RepID=A1C5Z9_ASPCL|nr:calcium/mangenease P-type ATPase, putative [Aspergillus clavatus NRRL 1]EAW13820.1 calcium/mangenease P-type ATPase, putative [Aspergillus clavatus NRRL 1]
MSSSATPALPLHNAQVSRSASATPVTGVHSPSTSTSTYSLLSPEETAQRLQTSLLHGLTPAEAEIRLLRDGANELPHEEPEPLWLRFLKQFKETLILLLLASAAISFFMGNYDDALSITLAVTIVVSVGFVQEYRSEKSLEALNRLVPHHAHLIRDLPASYIPPSNNAKAGATPVEFEMEHLKTRVPSTASAAIKASSTVLASELVPGDLVLFTTGDRIPADIRITAATDLSIDESNLTGENEPVVKYTDALRGTKTNLSHSPKIISPPRSPFYDAPASGAVGADIRLNEQHNIAFMGTLVRSGYGQGIVIGTGARTEFGSISVSLQEIESPRTPLQLSMDRLGQELSYISFGVIALIVVIGLIQGRKLLEMFTIGVSLAVAAIPEGLPIIVTVTLALGVLRMAKRGAIMRRLPSVETLGSVNVVCSDKTGTLTLNHMAVTKMWHFDCPEPFEIHNISSLTPGPAARTVLRIGNIANNARLSRVSANSPASASSAAVLSSTVDSASGAVKSRWVGQPTDVAILDLLDTFGEDDLRDRISGRVAETPFSSERKWMGVIIGSGLNDSTSFGGGTNVAYVKGALGQVLNRCDTYLTKDGREVILDEPRRNIVRQAAEQMASEGLRVLAFASGPVRDTAKGGRNFGSRSSTPMSKTSQTDEDDRYTGLVFAGLVGMNDPPRKDVHRSIRRLMSGGVRVIMITGDAETTAVAIAKKLGMPVNDTPGSRSVLGGDDLDRMSTEELAQAISSTSIFARTSPEHKMKIVRALQSRGDVVAMTGDGVNDAPALKKADIGIAMGKLGTDVAKEAADMILTDDDFSTILRAIEQGKGIFYNIQNFITFQLSTSVAALSLVLLSTILGFKNPLNAMQILWINILMDGPPAQSLGVEPVDPTIMNRPPRSRNARVLTKPLIQRVLTSAFMIMLGTLAIYVYEMGDIDDVANPGQRSRVVTAHDTTMTFTCFVLFDMFNALTCRSESKSVLRGELSLFGNKMFNYAVLGSLLGQACVIYLPFLQRVFQTEPLNAAHLFKLLCISSTVFWVDEGRKYLNSVKRRQAVGVGYSVNV